MDCGELRDRLLAGVGKGAAGFPAELTGEPLPEPLARHLATCAACTRFADRLAATRSVLRAEPAAPAPDPAFSRRVVASLPRTRTSDLLGWAALRALPAALALACALAYISSSEPPSLETFLSNEPSPDLLLTTGALAVEDSP
jgi:hypothetical protein